ncbi:hypothetical protein RJG79_03620 [Mycoplasmatota bacterium WC44]
MVSFTTYDLFMNEKTYTVHHDVSIEEIEVIDSFGNEEIEVVTLLTGVLLYNDLEYEVIGREIYNDNKSFIRFESVTDE